MFASNETSREDILEQLPSELPVLPLRNMVAYPFTVLPVSVGIPRSVKLVNEAMHSNHLVVLATSFDPEVDEPTPDQVHTTGGLALIQRVAQNDKGLQMVVTILERVKIVEWLGEEPYLRARIEVAPDAEEEDPEAEALRRRLIEVAQAVVALMPNVPSEVGQFLEQVESNRALVYMIAANANMELAARQELLETDSVNAKMRLMVATLAREREVLAVHQKTSSSTSSLSRSTSVRLLAGNAVRAARGGRQLEAA